MHEAEQRRSILVAMPLPQLTHLALILSSFGLDHFILELGERRHYEDIGTHLLSLPASYSWSGSSDEPPPVLRVGVSVGLIRHLRSGTLH